MRMTPKKYEHITNAVCSQFNTFGGGRDGGQNILAHTLKDNDPLFALGVDVADVVRAVILEYLRLLKAERKESEKQ